MGGDVDVRVSVRGGGKVLMCACLCVAYVVCAFVLVCVVVCMCDGLCVYVRLCVMSAFGNSVPMRECRCDVCVYVSACLLRCVWVCVCVWCGLERGA